MSTTTIPISPPGGPPARRGAPGSASGTPTGYVVLVPPAELDLSSAPRFLDEVLAHDPDHEIVIDMSGVVFCDSTGISALLSARRHVDERQGTLTLRRPAPPVRRVLDLTQVTDCFVIEA